MTALCEQLFNDKFFTAVLNSVVFWFIALILSFVSFKVLDKWMLPGVHFTDELKDGNMAVAIVIAAFMIGMFLVIFGVTN